MERAHFFSRLIAWYLDNVITNIPIVIFGQIIKYKIHLVHASIYIMFFLIFVDLLYFSFYAYKKNGQTLGKRWLRIRVAKLDGNKLSLSRFICRYFITFGLMVCPLMLFGENLGLLIWLSTYLLALTKYRRGLHDIIAGTQVIKV